MSAPSDLIVYGIALGSNTGDRLAHLQGAVASLGKLGTVSGVSAVYATEPVDCGPEAEEFLNAAAEVRSALAPAEVLAALREIERAVGRPDVRKRNASRALDLDILFADDLRVSTPDLEIPHPRLAGRKFVLRPMADLWPDRILPGQTEPASGLLAALSDGGEAEPRRYARLDAPRSAEEKEARLAAFAALKPAGKRIVSLTAADYPTARLLDEAGVDLILVGDSLGMVALGYPDTVDVTLAEMLHHTRAACRGVSRAPLVADLPWHTYETPAAALASARALTAAGADAVKLEGGVSVLPQVEAILADGIAFVGHIGMLPQSVREEGGYKKKGRTAEQTELLVADAVALDRAGALAIVLEGMTAAAADAVTAAVRCPTIGIGSGPECDGQILVTADLVGAFPWFRPPFAKARGDVAGQIRGAALAFSEAVRHDVPQRGVAAPSGR